MRVYHGTGRKHLTSIEAEGVTAPSYSSDSYDKALDYARSWGDPVVLACETDALAFEANMLVAQCMLDNGDLDALPDPDDLAHSLAYLEGIVCHDTVRNFEVLQDAHPGNDDAGAGARVRPAI